MPIADRIYFLNATTVGDSKAIVQCSNEMASQVVGFVGIHPWYVSEKSREELITIEKLVAANPLLFVGEIGLDRSPARRGANADLELQKYIFKKQLKLASRLDRPASLHCVKSWDTFFAVIQEIESELGKTPRGLIHCFQGSKEIARQLLSRDFYISVCPGRGSSEKNKDLTRFIPQDRLFIETDSDTGVQDKELQSYYQFVAETLNISVKQLSQQQVTNGEVFTNRKIVG